MKGNTARLARVLPFPARIKSNRQETEWSNVYQVCHLIQTELAFKWRAGETMKSMAAKCKVSPSTISKLACGETKAPRAETVLMVLRFLGYRVYIR